MKKRSNQDLEKELSFWKEQVKTESASVEHYKKTVDQLDKVLLEKELIIRDYKQNYTILSQRNDALQSALTHYLLECRRYQTEHMFKPDNQMRFEFKDGKWQALPFSSTDFVSLAG